MPGWVGQSQSQHSPPLPVCVCVCVCGGETILLTHMAVLPPPAWSTLALVWSSADTSIKTRLRADS